MRSMWQSTKHSVVEILFQELRYSMQQIQRNETETSSIPKPDSTVPMAPRSDQKEDVDEPEAQKQDPETDFSESVAESFQEDDAEAAELARLRCESVRTEEKKQPGKKSEKWKL